MTTLEQIEQRFDGPIPARELAIARFGSTEAVNLLNAEGMLAFYQTMVDDQLVTIRKRREDGTFYKYLLTDLLMYRAKRYQWERAVRVARRALEGALTPRRKIVKVLNSAFPVRNRRGKILHAILECGHIDTSNAGDRRRGWMHCFDCHYGKPPYITEQEAIAFNDDAEVWAFIRWKTSMGLSGYIGS